MKRWPVIFVSSTIPDLGDVRGALKHVLEQSLAARVLASEYSGFPVLPNQHTYEACLNAVRSADILIAIIDRRYGALIDNRSRISVTRAEIREAFSRGIPVYTLVRERTWDDRESFNQVLAQARTSDPSLTAAEFFSRSASDKVHGGCVESHLVYELIDEICAKPQSNWIATFKNPYDAIPTVVNWVTDYITHGCISPRLIDPGLTKGIRSLVGLVNMSDKHAEGNTERLSHALRAIGEAQRPDWHAVRRLSELSATGTESFCVEESKRIDQCDGRVLNKRTLYAVDSSMELAQADVWKLDPNYQRIVRASADLLSSTVGSEAWNSRDLKSRPH